ncbi:alanine racemase [Moellerella wisconsensis]|uniref:alanine racemase n=1 Tax=Moellerella wisconsensis TaxID=158849 RepID=UPI001F4E8B98|nr:alanine racemase [Moellerella wisconsensis]UNH41151.1 alanine racemase [Moellerella wisconsensis]
MPRPICAKIHLPNFTHNLSVIRQQVGTAKIWSVVKANAYGHNLAKVWPFLAATDGFALLELSEAIQLRQAGWQGPILLLEGFFHSSDLAVIDQYYLTTAIHSEWQLDALKQADLRHPISIYVKLNSGMNRLGFSPTDYPKIISRLQSLDNIASVTLMSHFANSDNSQGIEYAHQQIEAFSALKLATCVANSGAILWHPNTHYDWVRSGILLYGGSPSGCWHDIACYQVKATMTLCAEIIAVHHIVAGESIGYGSRFTATQPKRIATVACGYADGYPRHAPTGTPVWVDGVRCPILGAISMDMLTIDITDCPTAKEGTSVELWGQNLPIDDIAQRAGTVGYELMCGLAQRVPIDYET